jgi:hypothetical protein
MCRLLDTTPADKGVHVVSSVAHALLKARACAPLPVPRYVSKEVLREDLRHLDKADMFALGASLYELASDKRLPKGAPRRSCGAGVTC